LAEFVISAWRTVRREQAASEYPNPLALWNAKGASYLELAKVLPTMILRYEDLLLDPAGRIEQIARHFGIRRLDAEFRNSTQSTKEDGRTFEDFRSYYTEERWREKLSPEVARSIAARVDQSLSARFGYVLQ
jgi:hypothetical protein